MISVLTIPGVVRLKAVVDEQMVGFIAGDPHPGENLGWITTLGVLDSYRRRGIARALLNLCEEKMNLKKVRLCVRRGNAPAIALYHTSGYRIVDTWYNYYRSGEDALVLEKKRV